MAYLFKALTPNREEIDYCNVTGDLSSFFEYFDALEMDTGTNGDGSFSVSIEALQNFLKTENKYPHEMSGESILRVFISYVVNHTNQTQIIIDCM